MANHFAGVETVQPYPVLLVSPRIDDHKSLQRIFRTSRAKLLGACTASDALITIRRNGSEIPVVICEQSLPDGDWKLLLAELQRTAVQSRLIVCARLADERLWVEVLDLGAYDLLLCAPFVPEQVLRATESARRAWDSEGGTRVVPRTVHGVIPAGPKTLAAANTI